MGAPKRCTAGGSSDAIPIWRGGRFTLTLGNEQCVVEAWTVKQWEAMPEHLRPPGACRAGDVWLLAKRAGPASLEQGSARPIPAPPSA
jgi:hypothetical protein